MDTIPIFFQKIFGGKIYHNGEDVIIPALFPGDYPIFISSMFIIDLNFSESYNYIDEQVAKSLNEKIDRMKKITGICPTTGKFVDVFLEFAARCR